MNFLYTVRFPMCQKNKLGDVCLAHVSVWIPTPIIPPRVEKKIVSGS